VARPSDRDTQKSADPLPLAAVTGLDASADKNVWVMGETLTPAPTAADVRPTPSVVPDCPVATTVEIDPKKLGDQGDVGAEYCATEESGISVNPFDVAEPKVVRPKPGAALSDSQGSGRNCSKRLSACSFRPPVKVIAPAVTPPENGGVALLLREGVLSAGLRCPDWAPAVAAHQTT